MLEDTTVRLPHLLAPIVAWGNTIQALDQLHLGPALTVLPGSTTVHLLHLPARIVVLENTT